MRILGSLGYAAVAVLLLWTASAQAVERSGGTEADYKSIEALADQWIERYRARDVDGLVDLYTPDAWIQARKRPLVRGHDSIRGLLAGIVENTKVDMVTATEEVIVKGDWAWSIAMFMITYEPIDKDSKAVAPAVHDFGRALLIYEKSADGKWRISRDIDTPTADAEKLKAPRP